MTPAIPFFKKQNILYERPEKNGYWTFISTTHPETGEIIVNPTSREILQLCDGRRTLDQMRKLLKKRYTIRNDEQLVSDINQTVASFSRVGLIEWNGKNPFLFDNPEPMTKDVWLRIGQEYDLTVMRNFIRRFMKQPLKDYVCYFSPLIYKDEYNELNIRRKLFTYNEEFFLVFRKKTLIGLIAIELNTTPSPDTAATIKLLITPPQFMSSFIRYAQDNLLAIAVKDVTKITVFEDATKPLSKKLKQILKNEHYAPEGTLRHEFGFGVDAKLWARLYNKTILNQMNINHKKDMNL
jgi:hypothetical protein